MSESSDDWHAHRLLVTETLVRLDERSQRQEEALAEMRDVIGGLKVRVALISSAVSMAGTYFLNWIMEHHK
jgi:hypothetical protein